MARAATKRDRLATDAVELGQEASELLAAEDVTVEGDLGGLPAFSRFWNRTPSKSSWRACPRDREARRTTSARLSSMLGSAGSLA
jgi:hypothetical protein